MWLFPLCGMLLSPPIPTKDVHQKWHCGWTLAWKLIRRSKKAWQRCFLTPSVQYNNVCPCLWSRIRPNDCKKIFAPLQKKKTQKEKQGKKRNPKFLNEAFKLFVHFFISLFWTKKCFSFFPLKQPFKFLIYLGKKSLRSKYAE